jgi:hypothetical protein
MDMITRRTSTQYSLTREDITDEKSVSCNFSDHSTGLSHSFAINKPLTIKSSVLARKKESHKRSLYFHCPVAISCSSNMRLIVNDPSYINMGDIYDHFCDESGIGREDATFLVGEKIRAGKRGYQDIKELNVSSIVIVAASYIDASFSRPNQSIGTSKKKLPMRYGRN